jgi:hypothetical protein
MAQQTKSKSGRSSSGRRSSVRKSAATGRADAKSRSGTRRSQNGRASRGRSGAKASPRRSTSRPANSKGAIGTAKDTTVTGAKTAGNAVASAAKHVKTPAVAAGVGLAGLAGGIAIGRAKDKRSLGISLRGRSGAKQASKQLSSAVKDVGGVAEQTAQIAERVRLASEAVAGKPNAPRRSPIEVVLEGLTRRSSAAPRT